MLTSDPYPSEELVRRRDARCGTPLPPTTPPGGKMQSATAAHRQQRRGSRF